MPTVPDPSVLQRLLTDRSLALAIGRYADTGATERYRMFNVQLGAKRFVVPVAGVQGAGKSTFLNAIAFSEPILPVDADETTAVPVEIVWAERPDGLATIHFQDGRTEQVSASEEALTRFVHNDHNPGNELQVERIVLQSDSPVLQQGLVLVDLPGTGSLTEANIETTRQYLLEAVGIIFLLRTVPPLTRSDALFVAANWARLPMAFFVMNRWTDEREEEARDGFDYTVDRLAQIAVNHHIHVSGRLVVDVVVAYRALAGKLEHDAQRVEASGLSAFLGRLGAATKEWPALVAANIGEALREDLAAALASLELERSTLTASRSDTEARLAEEAEGFKEYSKKLEQLVQEGQQDVHQFADELEAKVTRWRRDARGWLRNNMRTKMRGGIVDGERLDEALSAEQGKEGDRIFEEVEEMILGFQDRMRERFRDLPSWKGRRTQGEARVNIEEKTKYENALPIIVGNGTGLAGAWWGAKLGAQIGLGGGPLVAGLGMVIGGLVGFFVGGWLGSKAKGTVTTARAAAAEPQVFAAIDRFLDHTAKGLHAGGAKVRTEVGGMLAGWKEEQRAQYESERSRVVADLGATQAERAERLQALNADAASLQLALVELTGRRS